MWSMIVLKERKEPIELKKLRLLNPRMKLSHQEELYYLNLEKGYQGELIFDQFMKNLSTDWPMVNDLLLKQGHIRLYLWKNQLFFKIY